MARTKISNLKTFGPGLRGLEEIKAQRGVSDGSRNIKIIPHFCTASRNGPVRGVAYQEGADEKEL
jgi:hypothetical protein